MSELSNSEIQSIVEKIRSEYNHYAKENPKMFKLLPFEERYTEVLRLRANIQNFLHAEIEFLEKLKQLHEEHKRKAEITRSSTIDKIIEQQEEKMKRYPKIEFHPAARNDLKYFYGAMVEFVENELVLLNRIFRGTPEIRSLQDHFITIERIGTRYKTTPSVRIAEHINTINNFRGNSSKIEQDTQVIIRDTCLALKNLILNLEDILHKNRFHEAKTPIEEKDSSKLKALYEGLNNSKTIQKIIDRCKGIISDFRMEGILSWKH